MKYGVWTAMALAVLLACAGCGKKAEVAKEEPKGPRPVPVTAASATVKTVELREESVGYIEASEIPAVSAEAPGRVERVLKDNGDSVKKGDVLAKLDDTDLKLRHLAARADAARVETLALNAEKNLGRLKPLLEQGVVSEQAWDDASAQLSALREQLSAARAGLSAAERDLAKAVIRSPVSGIVQNRMVGAGDYVGPGKPVYQITNDERVQAHLPFPEALATKIRVGQKVRLSTPVDPENPVEGTVSEIRPSVAQGTRAIDVIVSRKNPGKWRSGASVNGSILLGQRPGAVVVPAICVVLRPAGEVVYLLEEGKARQAVVETGVRGDGVVEILKGLKGDETIVADGAAFLTDGALVKVSGPAQGNQK